MAQAPKKQGDKLPETFDWRGSIFPPDGIPVAPPAAVLPADVLKKLELNSAEQAVVGLVCGSSPKLLKLINQVDDPAGTAFLKAIETTLLNPENLRKSPEERSAELKKAIDGVIKAHPKSTKPLTEIMTILEQDGGKALQELATQNYLRDGWQKRLFSFFDPKSETIDPERTAKFQANIIGSCLTAATKSIFPNGVPQNGTEMLQGLGGVLQDYKGAMEKLEKWTKPPKGQQDAHLQAPADENRAILALRTGEEAKGNSVV